MQELPEDNLDGLFRKSAEEFDPTFDPADWKDMNAKLDEHDRKALWGQWITKSLIALVVLLFIGVGWYSWQVMNAGGASTRLRSGLPAGTQPTATRPTSNQPTKQPQGQSGILNTSPADRSPGLVTESQPENLARSTENNQKAKAETVKALAANESLPASKETGNTGAVANTNRISSKKADLPGMSHTAQKRLKANSDNSTLAHTAPTNGLPLKNREATGTIADSPSKRLVKRQSNRDGQVPASVPGTPVYTSAGVKSSNQPVLDDKQDVLTKTRPNPTVVGGNESQSLATNSALRSRSTANPDASELSLRSEVLNPPEIESAEMIEVERLNLTVNSLSAKSLRWPAFDALDNQVIHTPETDVKQPAKAKPKVSGLSLRALLSPDLTTIGLKNFSRPGTNLGLVAEYRFSNRWSIQAGGVWNKKVYSAYGSEYAWPMSIYGTQRAPDEVVGTCNMVDIPVNVRYDILLIPRQSGRTSRLFTSAGATGFVLLKERYDYQYNNPAHIYKWYWQGKTGWNGFSHLNFSVGYEQHLTRRLAWQVEPFMKMPLKGVGFFKINLISTGAFLSLRYKL